MPRAAELDFRNSKITREGVTIAFAQALGHATPDELLNVSRVSADQARKAGIVFAVFLDQALEHGSLVDICHVRNVDGTLSLDK